MSKWFHLFLFLGSVGGCASNKSTQEEAVLAEAKKNTVYDLTYAERTGVKLLADWHPSGSTKLRTNGKDPVCIVIHGGGWYKGNKKEMDSVAKRLSEHGFSVLNISYRLAPAHRFPSPVHDTKDAIRWVKLNAEALNIDTKRVCLLGYSAGAHLSLLAGFTLPKDGLDDTSPPSAKIFRYPSGEVVTSSLPADLSVQAIVAGGAPSDLMTGNYNEYYEKFFGRPATEIPETYKKASPITFVRKGNPPVFLYHGKNDWIVKVEQSRHMVDLLRQNNVDVEYLEVTFGHVATFLFDEKEIAAAINFLTTRLANAR